MGPVWGPAAVGAIVGAAFAALNRMGMKRIWRAPYSPLNVVVTGGTRGLGKAMAREFLKYGPDDEVPHKSACVSPGRAGCQTCPDLTAGGL